MRTLTLLLLLVSAGFAQEPRVISLGLGRSRLELVLERRQALRPDDETRVEIGRLSFRDRWLQRELPRLVPGLESVDVIERIQARSNAAGLSAARDRVLELTGPDDTIAAADRLLRRIVATPDRRIRARTWLVQLREAAPETSAPAFEVLGEEALNRRLAELAANENALIVETAELDFPSGGESSIAVGNRIDYVRDHRVSSAAGRLFIEPVHDSFQEGLLWSLAALLEPDGNRLHVEAGYVLARAARPLARLEGPIGPSASRLAVEKPIVAETRWSTDGLVLRPGDFGFRVTGLTQPDPAVDAKGPGRRLEILCQIEAVTVAVPEEGGLVQGFDRAERLAFVLVAEGARVVGDVVLIERDGRKVGAGRIDEVLGRLVSVKLSEGEARLGDRLR